MKPTGFKDIFGKDIFAGMICEDTQNFSTCIIKKYNDSYCVIFNNSKPEPLKAAYKYLKIIK